MKLRVVTSAGRLNRSVKCLNRGPYTIDSQPDPIAASTKGGQDRMPDYPLKRTSVGAQPMLQVGQLARHLVIPKPAINVAEFAGLDRSGKMSVTG